MGTFRKHTQTEAGNYFEFVLKLVPFCELCKRIYLHKIQFDNCRLLDSQKTVKVVSSCRDPVMVKLKIMSKI